jgi:hypothetical protein
MVKLLLFLISYLLFFSRKEREREREKEGKKKRRRRIEHKTTFRQILGRKGICPLISVWMGMAAPDPQPQTSPTQSTVCRYHVHARPREILFNILQNMKKIIAMRNIATIHPNIQLCQV